MEVIRWQNNISYYTQFDKNQPSTISLPKYEIYVSPISHSLLPLLNIDLRVGVQTNLADIFSPTNPKSSPHHQNHS
jgi:hypothetical protein